MGHDLALAISFHLLSNMLKISTSVVSNDNDNDNDAVIVLIDIGTPEP